MFQVAPFVVILGYLLIAILGTTVAVVSGIGVSAAFKLRIRLAVVAKDALLGALGSVATVIVSLTIPWQRNTVSAAGSGIQLETTMNRFQHPYMAAMVVAIILPSIHQFIRQRLTRK